MKTLKNLIPLEHSLKIFVPSTINVSKKIDNSKYIDKTLSFLSELFGGATSYNAMGCWKSTTDGIIKEKVIICESFCKEHEMESSITKIIGYCEKMKRELSQEAISLEVDNKLYFI